MIDQALALAEFSTINRWISSVKKKEIHKKVSVLTI